MIKFVSNLRQVGGFLRALWYPISNKTDRHDIAEILLTVALSTITLTSYGKIITMYLFDFMKVIKYV